MSKLVIFDCDGVLVESEIMGNQVMVECFKDYGIHMSLADTLNRFKGRRLAECLGEVQLETGIHLPQNFVPNFRERLAEHMKTNLKAIAGIEDVLKNLKYPACVASNGPIEQVNTSLDIVDLKKYFKGNLFSAYQVQKWKPEPDLFLHACKKMRALPSDAVVVEDSESGVMAAIRANIKVLAFGPVGNWPKIPGELKSFDNMKKLPALIDEALA